MQCGVGKDRIEGLVRERQRLGSALVGIDSPHARRGQHLRRCVHAHDDCAGGDKPSGQLAIAAAQVENALAGLRRQPFEHPIGQFMHKCAVLLIGARIPRLRHRQPPLASVADAEE